MVKVLKIIYLLPGNVVVLQLLFIHISQRGWFVHSEERSWSIKLRGLDFEQLFTRQDCGTQVIDMTIGEVNRNKYIKAKGTVSLAVKDKLVEKHVASPKFALSGP